MVWKWFLPLVAAGLILILFAFTKADEGDGSLQTSKEIIAMREIAHRILLYAGDSTSTVLPAKRISAYEFEIPFERPFTFKADSFAAIIDQVIANTELPKKYLVKVMQPGSDALLYGYVHSESESNSVPCGVRNQALIPYTLRIQFEETVPMIPKYAYISGIGLFAVAFLILLGYKKSKIREAAVLPVGTKTKMPSEGGIRIGNFLFFPEEQCLSLGNEKITLSIKETRILGILATTPNEIINRNLIQKEVWEDEGVIVGRSLDMFISKLRKKLEADPMVKIVNIHGRGYKLESGSAY